MAWLAEAQARVKEEAGISFGNCGSRLTSRPMFGTRADGTTCPKITSSTSWPSRFVRSSSSRVAYRPRSTARAFFNAVPALLNGVRTPATTATRRPWRPGIRFCPFRQSSKPTTSPKWRGVAGTAVRNAAGHGRYAVRSADHRRRHHGRRDRAGRGTPRLSHRVDRQGRLRRRHVVAFLAADSRRHPLSGAGGAEARVRGQPGAARVAGDRAASRAPARVSLSDLSRQPRSRLEAARRHVAVRSAGRVPQRAPPSVVRRKEGAEYRARPARPRTRRRRALLRRAGRRRAARTRDVA